MCFLDLHSNVVSSHSESAKSQDDWGERGWNIYQRDQSMTAIKDAPEIKRHRMKTVLSTQQSSSTVRCSDSKKGAQRLMSRVCLSITSHVALSDRHFLCFLPFFNDGG